MKSLGEWPELFSGSACRLVENDPGAIGQYVSLSYCWGKSLAYTTTSKNIQEHKQKGGIPFKQLPETLQDAAYIVRYLGFDHVWADCLCIVQDDKEDWEREAARMADVYSNADLCLSATRASHCREGFLAQRSDKGRQLVQFTDGEGSFPIYFVYRDATASPGSMESVNGQPLRLERVLTPVPRRRNEELT